MPATLERYRKKRDFKATPEPTGGRRHAKTALSFVIQKHDASHLHYDFRLELDGVLKSWAVPKGPSLDPSVKRMAVQVEDHPIDYANFEGVIPAGQYGAGTVLVWDTGSWEPIGDAREGYASGKLKFALHGKKLRGHWMLIRMHGHEGERQVPWLLIKERDGEARGAGDYDVLLAEPDSALQPLADMTKPAPSSTAHNAAANNALAPAARPAAKKTSVKTVSKTLPKPTTNAQVAVEALLARAPRADLPLTLAPQLATLVDAAPSAGEWIYELKFDGYRIVARIDGGDVRLFTRNGHDWTAKLEHLAKAIAALQLEGCWLDGEIVIADDAGRSDFQALQNAFEARRSIKTSSIQYYVFDLPFYARRDLRSLGLLERRAILASVIPKTNKGAVRLSESFDDDVEKLLSSVCSMQMEGLVGKRTDSPYTSSRSKTWIKLKCGRRQEFVIGGYTDPKGSRTGLGALLLGVYDDRGKLRYAGNVGTGFSTATLTALRQSLDPLATQKPPFEDPPKERAVHWVKPQLVGEVSFAEWTSDHRLRHAVFHGLRSDKDAKAIKKEVADVVNAAENAAVSATVNPAASKSASKRAAKSAVSKSAAADRASASRKIPAIKSASAVKKTTALSINGIAISHPDRVIDTSSGITKGELAEYYSGVSTFLLPHLEQRPLSLLRAPAGISGTLVFQRHGDRLLIPGLVQLDAKLWPEHPPLIAIDSEQGIIGAAQINAVELHTWNACIDKIDRPDRLIFDLDPGQGLAFDQVIEATRLTAELLKELGLACFIKTSGGKGMHVVVPIARRYSWDSAKEFSKAVVEQLARTLPDRFVAKSGPKNRVGRVFVDVLRNAKGATTATAFSVRARAGLGVSMPVALKELGDIESASQWTVSNALSALKKRRQDPWQNYRDAKQQRLEGAARKLGHTLKGSA